MQTYCHHVIRSLRWPGAVTIAQSGRKFTSVYIGNGLKKGQVCFHPELPPEVMRDPVDLEEQPEPTPLEEPIPEPEVVEEEE
jgi:hypothetical protein